MSNDASNAEFGDSGKTLEMTDMLQAIFEASPLAISAIDQNGIVVLWNRSAERIFGWDANEIAGKPLPELPNENDKKQRNERVAALLHGKQLKWESLQKRKDGVEIWISTSAAPVHNNEGKVIGAVAMQSDITERKEGMLALKEAEERYRLLFEKSPVPKIVFDAWSFEIVAVNDAAVRHLGWSREEFIRMTLLDIIPPDEQTNVLNAVNTAGWNSDYKGVHRHLKKDGELIDVEVNASLFASKGRREKIVALHDITERKRFEASLTESNAKLHAAMDELKETQNQVIQQERLRALGAMASGIAHDFNNALSPILGFSEILLEHPERYGDWDKMKRYIESINTSAKDAASVVGRLRDFYRHREKTDVFSEVNLADLVDQVIDLSRPKWKDIAQASGITIAVNKDIPADLVAVASPSELREMLANLIFNAVDAMPHDGSILLRARKVGDDLRLEVSDTGTGMSEDVRRRCLEPFFTTKGERGTGLGLSMVAGIIRRHNGTLDIQSKPGNGTTFLIRIPINSGATTVEQVPVTPVHAAALRVLLVDDQPLVREVTKDYLEMDGHMVVTAENGRDALLKFKAGSFDLVITDRSMPEMSGDQIAPLMKSLAPKTPIILLTGFGELMEAAGEEPRGVDLIVGKPVTIAMLREAIAKLAGSEPRS